jgi:hypothetical protein
MSARLLGPIPLHAKSISGRWLLVGMVEAAEVCQSSLRFVLASTNAHTLAALKDAGEVTVRVTYPLFSGRRPMLEQHEIDGIPIVHIDKMAPEKRVLDVHISRAPHIYLNGRLQQPERSA